jgi:[protein-PII] uridylyltransferase
MLSRMPTLLDKIQASAAERLTLPPGRKPVEELARYKQFLKVETHRLRILHRAGAGGLQVCRARAAVLDELIRHIFEAVRAGAGDALDLRKLPVSIVAIGGYGRGELNPFSDLDIMFLHHGDQVTGNRARPQLSALVDGLLYTLWDIGLKVGHSVRSVEDCVAEANRDMQSKTALIEARLVAGDEPLFKRLQSVVLAKCVRGYEDAYVAMRLEDQAERRAKHGNSACMQEPNLKNGSGGLRDYQNLMWMAFFKYRITSLADLEQRGEITGGERRQLESAYDFILRARNELHYHTGRAADVLTRNTQAAVAYNLGYTSRSPVKRIEAMMRDLYNHLRNVDIITRNVEQRLALVRAPSRMRAIRDLLVPRALRAREQVVDGFRIAGGSIHAVSPRVFRDQPRRLMRVFLLAQQRGLALHPDLAALVRGQLALVDRAFLADAHVHETFLEILSQRGSVAPVLRAMHEVGLLGKYLPEFGRLTCLVQHEFYHQYAADEHTLMCVQKLDEIASATQPPSAQYAGLFNDLPRPAVLYLALLLHDTGKSDSSGKHELDSRRNAERVARRLKLDGATTDTLCRVIEHHLEMFNISQRRDLDDPAVIRHFAALVGGRETLDLLMLHSYADSLGTAEQLWNGFKDSLLWTLYRKTEELLSGGTQFVRAEERQRELLLDEVRRLLPATIQPDEVDAHFNALPPRYFQVHTTREIAGDVARAHRFMHYQLAEDDRALSPVVSWRNEPDRGAALVQICTWDRAGLFGKITGALAAAGMNILNARIFSRSDGIVLDAFHVLDAGTGRLPTREAREQFEEYLRDALERGRDLGPLIAKRETRRLYEALDREAIPTRIRFDNEASDTRTVIDLETEDRVGLLYVVSRTLAELGVDISLAKISTEKGAAVDSFYVTELEGGKIEAPERLRFIEQRLRAAIAQMGG